jgi:capsular polysaccharide biosynthesis protein
MQDNRNENVIEIDLEELFGLVMHSLPLILAAGIATAVAAFLISAFVVSPKYESTTGIYVMSRQDGNTLSYSDTQLSTQMTKDYEELISSRYVLETVIAQCGLDEEYEDLLDRVEIENATDTRIIYITVKDEEPERAQYIADSIREVASAHITAVTDVEAVNVVDPANLPNKPSEPSIPIWTIVGALVGLVVSALVVIARFMLDDTIKTSDDVEKYLSLSTLGMIPVREEQDKTKHKKSSHAHPGQDAADKNADSKKDMNNRGTNKGNGSAGRANISVRNLKDTEIQEEILEMD